MTDWIEHNGGPQPVDDNVWVEVNDRVEGHFAELAQGVDWKEAQGYRILNQHLIDAKQAEIDALRDDLETWQSVFPHVMPDRLKSDQQLAEEDVAAKIAAARLEGIRLGLEAAHKAIVALDDVVDEAERSVLEDACMAVCAIDPETIAQEAQHD